MQLLITVRNRSSDHYANLSRLVNLQIDVPEKGTVNDVAEILSKRVKVPPQSFRIILCGKVLGGATPLKSLLLGPQTSLSAIVVDVCEESSTESSSNVEHTSIKTTQYNDTARTDVPSFQVFCKNCNSLARGKLRVYCSSCASSSILLSRDPQQWSDVLKLRTIKGECENCEEETFAEFCFKCIKCDQKAVPLTHVRGYRGEGECSICGETSMKVVVDVGCGHQTCKDCFVAYMEASFEQNSFIILPPHGYTLSCPVYGCRGCITDAHTYYLLGRKRYDEYQRQAAEKFVALQNEGFFCPYSECGAAFLVEQEVKDDTKILCPECHRLFCATCRREHCVCAENDATQLTIKVTCRKCPTCGVSTERNGGCSHIHCTNCDAHWCFICCKPWSEECQWDHWFD